MLMLVADVLVIVAGGVVAATKKAAALDSKVVVANWVRRSHNLIARLVRASAA